MKPRLRLSMPTFTQAILLGTERLHAAPTPPHSIVGDAWAQLDWSGAKETALLEASALLGSARSAGALTGGPLPAPEPAPAETQPLAPSRAVDVLRRVLGEEWRALLPEWLEACARHGCRIPPFYLPTLFEIATDPDERALLLRSIGQRGRWLARQHPAWAWAQTAEPAPDLSLWETGTEEERLAALRHVRTSTPAQATEKLASTWPDETPEFRARALSLFVAGLSLDDEPLLTRALSDRRKDVRTAAQALLATLPESGLASRMRARADALLTLHRGLLGKKLEIRLPDAFDPAWKGDGIEEKPPAGVGEKAYWTQQILGLVPLAYWTVKYDTDAPALIALATKSSDWGDLLIGAWFRAACMHRDPDASAALIRPIRERPKALSPGAQPQSALVLLLSTCREADRWQIAAAEPELAWIALPLLTGTPDLPTGRALLDQVAQPLREGFNPGGSPTAVLAARRIPPALRDEAARLLTRENGRSKPAEAFLQALDLRAELHAAFATSRGHERQRVDV